jgi:uncharacterized protein with PIN domain
MGYRLPSTEEVEHAIAAVLRREKKLPSENRFLSLVRRELKRRDKDYTVSHERLRKIALRSGLCKVTIHTRESATRRPMARCPVCSTRVQSVKNETIFGGSVTLGYECPFCGYWTGMRRRVPQRYVFSSMVGGKRDVPAVRFMDMPDES